MGLLTCEKYPMSRKTTLKETSRVMSSLEIKGSFIGILMPWGCLGSFLYFWAAVQGGKSYLPIPGNSPSSNSYFFL